MIASRSPRHPIRARLNFWIPGKPEVSTGTYVPPQTPDGPSHDESAPLSSGPRASCSALLVPSSQVRAMDRNNSVASH